MRETSTYALVHASGQLQFLTGSPPSMNVGDTAPVNLSLIAASWAGHGLQAWATTAVDQGVETPNQIASTMIAALGGPAHQQWHLRQQHGRAPDCSDVRPELRPGAPHPAGPFRSQIPAPRVGVTMACMFWGTDFRQG